MFKWCNLRHLNQAEPAPPLIQFNPGVDIAFAGTSWGNQVTKYNLNVVSSVIKTVTLEFVIENPINLSAKELNAVASK